MDGPSESPRHSPDPQMAQWRPDRAGIAPAPSLPKNAIYRDYAAAPEAVFDDLADTVKRLGYKINKKDREQGRLIFLSSTSLNTYRGQKMTAAVTAYDDRTRLRITGQQRLRIQFTDWGEHERVARRVLRAMDPLKPVLAENLTNPSRKYATIGSIVLLLVVLAFFVALMVGLK